MITQWRQDGISRDAFEVWVVGPEASEETLTAFVGTSEASCYFDDGATTKAWKARKDDMFLVDAAGQIAHHMYLADTPLSSPGAVLELDTVVRQTLAQ